jgi:hypothetical protein
MDAESEGSLLEGIEQHCLSKDERIRKYGEVFTSQWVVDKMCDMLESESPDCYQIEKTFLEPSCGEGIFVVEILRRKFSRCKKRSDYTTALKSVYGFELQEDNVKKTIENVKRMCNEYFKPTKEELEIINNHIIQADALKVMKLLSIWGRGDLR